MDIKPRYLKTQKLIRQFKNWMVTQPIFSVLAYDDVSKKSDHMIMYSNEYLPRLGLECKVFGI